MQQLKRIGCGLLVLIWENVQNIQLKYKNQAEAQYTWYCTVCEYIYTVPTCVNICTKENLKVYTSDLRQWLIEDGL